jgi:hypothetical protein
MLARTSVYMLIVAARIVSKVPIVTVAQAGVQALLLDVADVLAGGGLAEQDVLAVPLAVPAEPHRVVLGLAVRPDGGTTTASSIRCFV